MVAPDSFSHKKGKAMRGYVPIPSLSKPGVTTFMLSTAVNELMHPDAILVNDDSPNPIVEARDILKQTYPDIEKGYGQVMCSGGEIDVYDKPGFNISSSSSQFSVELLVEICKKYGTVRYYPNKYGVAPSAYNAANEAGLVRSSVEEGEGEGDGPNTKFYCTYRYDEKVLKRRLKKKAAPAKRNHTFLVGIIARLAHGAKGNGSLISTNTGDVKFPPNFSIQEQALMRLELFLLTNTRETAKTFDSVKKAWEDSDLDPKTTNEHSIKTIKMLDKLFRDN